jgi:uncharacterized protein
MNNEELSERIAVLEQTMRQRKRVLLAFSGGVDSTFLAVIGARTLKQDFLAVTVDHLCLPRREQTMACNLAEKFFIPHKVLSLDQWKIKGFQDNPPERCYLCKKALMGVLLQEAKEGGFPCLMDGSNADDLNDFRPGSKALEELGVESPLQALGWDKQSIRMASRLLGLPTADLPSYACLASRIPTNSPITPEKLWQIEQMEDLLHKLGFVECRARHHGDILRLEIAQHAFATIVAPDNRAKLLARAHAVGFRWLTLDLEPYCSGRLNPNPPPP